MARLATLLLVASLTLGATAGCLSDIERAPLETRWAAEGTLYETPTATIEDRPAQLVVNGPVTISDNAIVQLTGIQGSLETGNASIPLIPIRVTIQETTFSGSALDDEGRNLSDGDRVQVSFLPRPANETQLTARGETNWSAHAELQYRYRVGDRFDAGRIAFDANLTPQQGDGLGTGAPRTDGNQIQSLVFERINQPPVEGAATARIYHVTADGAELIADQTVELEPGEGVVLASLQDAITIREGDGYLLFTVHNEEMVGTVSQPDTPSEQPIPAPGVLILVASLAGLAIARRLDL